MANTWILFEESNVDAEGIMDSRFIRRNFEVYSDFETAKQAMRETIRTYALTDGDLFDGAGNIQGAEDLCGLLKDFKVHLEKPGERKHPYVDDFDDEDAANIELIPILMRKAILGESVQDLDLPNDVDATLALMLKVYADWGWKEVDFAFEFGNVKSSEIALERQRRPWEEYENIAKNAQTIKSGQFPYIHSSYPPPRRNYNFPPADIETNSFTMDDPDASYYYRVVGRCDLLSDAFSFMNVELIALEQQ